MNKALLFFVLTGLWLYTLCISTLCYAHGERGHGEQAHGDNTAHYLGNEAVLVVSGSNKALFDPFFHNGFGIYQTVPQDLRNAIFAATPPFDNVDLIVISHAHEDHFSASDVVRYMESHPNTNLVAPQQAIDQLYALSGAVEMKARIHPVALGFGDQPWKQSISGLKVEAVRIPHAGWPGRADVENIVFRVEVDTGATVMHLGDADPNYDHYKPHQMFWQEKSTQLGFPPYWFLYDAEGRYIMDKIGVQTSVGVHVPLKVPDILIKSGADYFSKPSDTRSF